MDTYCVEFVFNFFFRHTQKPVIIEKTVVWLCELKFFKAQDIYLDQTRIHRYPKTKIRYYVILIFLRGIK